MIWTEEDIEKVKKFIEIKRRGHYVETHELTSVYNRVLEKNVSNTTCGSCLRQRVEELERALRKYEADKAKAEENKAQEAPKKEEVNDTPEEQKEADTEQIKEEETKEENNNGTEGKSPATAKKRKASKSKTT